MIALIFESPAVDVVDFVRGKIKLSEERARAVRIAIYIQFVIAIKVIESGELMLPAVWRDHRQSNAAQQIIELRPVAGIGRQGNQRASSILGDQRIVSVETPFSRESGMRVGVAKMRAERNRTVDLRPDICAFDRVGVRVVHSRALAR